jgi:hypothetical protein
MWKILVACASALALSLGLAAAAGAAGGWRVVQRSSDRSDSLFTFASVYSVSGQPRGRVTVRAPRGRVVLNVSRACSSANFARRVSRGAKTIAVSAGPSRPIVRLLAPTFAAAARCSFTVGVTALPGTLRVVLETRR